MNPAASPLPVVRRFLDGVTSPATRWRTRRRSDEVARGKRSLDEYGASAGEAPGVCFVYSKTDPKDEDRIASIGRTLIECGVFVFLAAFMATGWVEGMSATHFVLCLTCFGSVLAVLVGVCAVFSSVSKILVGCVRPDRIDFHEDGVVGKLVDLGPETVLRSYDGRTTIAGPNEIFAHKGRMVVQCHKALHSAIPFDDSFEPSGEDLASVVRRVLDSKGRAGRVLLTDGRDPVPNAV